MPGPHFQQLIGVTSEAAPLGIVGDLLKSGVAQVPFDALLAEDVDALGAAEYHASLATPPAEELAAVLASLELAAVVEVMAALADGHLQNVVQTDLGHGSQREAQMLEAGRTVILQLCYCIDVRVNLVVFLKVFYGGLIVDEIL